MKNNMNVGQEMRSKFTTMTPDEIINNYGVLALIQFGPSEYFTEDFITSHTDILSNYAANLIYYKMIESINSNLGEYFIKLAMPHFILDKTDVTILNELISIMRVEFDRIWVEDNITWVIPHQLIKILNCAKFMNSTLISENINIVDLTKLIEYFDGKLNGPIPLTKSPYTDFMEVDDELNIFDHIDLTPRFTLPSEVDLTEIVKLQGAEAVYQFNLLTMSQVYNIIKMGGIDWVIIYSNDVLFTKEFMVEFHDELVKHIDLVLTYKMKALIRNDLVVTYIRLFIEDIIGDIRDPEVMIKMSPSFARFGGLISLSLVKACASDIAVKSSKIKNANIIYDLSIQILAIYKSYGLAYPNNLVDLVVVNYGIMHEDIDK